MEEQDERVGRRRKIEIVIKECTPYVLSIVCTIFHAGFNIISKVALDKGMSYYVLVVYGHAFGTLTTALLAFIFERKHDVKLSIPILRNIICLGALGPIFGRTLYYVGLELTSPVLASAVANTVPSTTFILAILFRMEKFDISKRITQAKAGGTVVAFAGATIMTMYKGIAVLSIHMTKYSPPTASPSELSVDKKWIKGSILLVVSFFSYSGYLILQTTTVKAYPAPMTLTSLTCLSGTLLSAIVAAFLDHKASSWRLPWNITLLAPLYSGIVIFGVVCFLQILVMRSKGPVFMTAFRPVSTLLVAIVALLFLGEALHLGSVLGAVLIVIGLYATLWGKKKESGEIRLEHDVVTTQDIEDKLPEK